MKKILLMLMFMGMASYSISQSSSCFESDPFCTGTSYEFPASTNAPPAEDGPNYGCLATQPNPVWYHMRIEQPGDIVIDMFSEPLVDIDFIAWGPFDDPYEPCLDDLNGDKIEDCSYSPSSTETCNITDAQEGEYYILMITNFSNQECNINFSQTGGDGATDCGILPGQISSNSPVCEGDTLFLSANTVSGAEYNWTGPDGFTSSQQEIVIPDASQDNAGEYELIIEVDDEVSEPVYYDVVVHETPQISAGADQSIPFGTFTDLAGETEGNPSDYTILWEPEAFLQENGILNPTTTNLEASVEYQLEVSSTETGCSSYDGTVVTVTGGPLSVEVSTIAEEICYGEQTQLRAQTSGGSGNYEYEWSAESGDFSSDIYNPTIAPESTTTYNVEVTDGFNTVTGQVTVVVNELPAVEAVEDFSIPYGTSTTLEASASGGTGNYSYEWEDDTFLQEDDVPNPQTTNLYNPTTFTVEVTDAKGCQSPEDQTLVSLSGGPLTAVPSASSQTICYGDTTLLKAAASGGSEEYSYSWKKDGSEFSQQAELQVHPQETTTYELVADDGFNQSTKSLTIQVNPLPEVDLVPEGYTATNDTMMVCVYDTLILDAAPGTQANYLWDNGSAEAVKQVATSGISFDMQTHEVRVENSQTGCVSNKALTVVFSFSQCTGIEELEKQGISIYPVPANEQINIVLKDWNGEGSIILSDLTGRKLRSKTFNAMRINTIEENIDVGHLKPGIYIISISKDDRKAHAKIVIE